MRLAGSVIAIITLLGSMPVVALQDPTRPPGLHDAAVRSLPLRSLSLDSIVYGEDRKVAVIEGEALREGQGANGIRVRKIHQDRVEVLDRGRPRILYLDKLPQVRGTQ
ncbi:hypothetical protein MD273_16805 [Marinobacter pelagius]|uniref:hypothetical protein n=1 Tax=Marinobacter sp. C7 TaxID=2951363 RepID=UPI001EEFFE54|nr:hypothetical protein [Marinobacter sp. C7]MCG7201399.1 hypothetical protein [Marinobacter sp. C7]